jgi:hypothetical protein
MKKTAITAMVAIMLVPVVAFAATEEAVDGGSAVELKTRLRQIRETKLEVKASIKEEILEKSKRVAVKSIERAQKRYQRISQRVAEMPNISETEKAIVKAQIEVDLAKLDVLKTKAESAGTLEEIKSVMSELKTTLRSSKTAVQAKVDAIHATRLTKVTDKLTSILEKLGSKISDLKSAGKDTAEIEALENSAKKYIETARTNIAARNFDKSKENILEARKVMIEMSQKIKAER